jgi:hypothetical protein
MIIFIIPRIYPWLYSDCDISLWICMYCLKLYLLYLIIIVLRATGKISLLLLTVLPSWNKVITYLLTYLLSLSNNSPTFLLNRTMISPFTSSYSSTTEKCVVYCTDLHWGGFTTQWGDKKRINGADEKYTIWWISKCIHWAEFRTHLHVPFFSHWLLVSSV